MTTEILRWGVAAVFAGSLLCAAIYDIRWRRIPNWTVLLLLAGYILATGLDVAPSKFLSGLGAAAITFVVTYLLYHFNIFGAGDAKLFSVAALFAGMSNLTMFVLLTLMAGGAIALGFLVFRPDRAIRAMTTRGRSSGEKSGIPYGVAIAIGGIAMGLMTPGFFPGVG